MKINLVAIGTKMPAWVNEGYEEYAKRLPKEFQLHLIEIPALKRGKTLSPHLIEQEGELLLNAIPAHNKTIALERTGKAFSTLELTQQLGKYHGESQDVSLLIGGPEGLSSACLQQAELKWSLSTLTLPHPLVRVVIAEQIYRAWSIMSHHPYHR